MCRIVSFSPAHTQRVVDVVKAVHDEYGFSWEADGYHRDLYHVEEHYVRPGGVFWVCLAGDRVVGCTGVALHGSACELHRMYLLREYRGRGLGRRFLEMALAYGRSRGCRRMAAWSDVKLTDAHRLYLKSGFVQQGQRICDDPDRNREYGFWKEPL